MMNFYTTLGVREDADPDTIKRAYRKLVKECHPDTHPGDAKAEERFKRVSEAYAVLTDSKKRTEYDRKIRRMPKEPEVKRTEPIKRKKTGPIDAGALFERYMGFK